MNLQAKPAERLPLSLILVYSLAVSASVWANGVNSLTMPVFNIELGVDITILSTMMAVLRIVDAFTDPLVANWSDNLRSRFGRRRPYILVGGIAMGILFAALWMFPHDWPRWAYAAWYGILTLLFALATTIFSTGYFALGIELAPNYRERTRIFAIRSYFQKVSQLLNPWLYPLIQLSIFGGALNGVRWIGAAVGGAIIAVSLITALLSPERFADINEKIHKPKLKLLSAIWETSRNRYFWMLVFTGLALGASLSLFDSLALYLNIYFVYGGDKVAGAKIHGISSTLATVLSIASVPLVWWLCNRFGKHNALRLALGWMFIGSILKFWLYSPTHPYLQLVLPFFYSIGISSFFLVIGTMMADVVDVDELQTGRRREAMFGALGSWINKLALAGTVALSGFIVKWTGFDFALGGDQSPQTFLKMRILYSFVAGFLILVALLFLMKYDLTEEKCNEIKVELEKRRKGVEKISRKDCTT